MAESNPTTRKNRKRGAGEGCIFQRRDGRWCAVITTGYENGKQQRKLFYGTDRDDVHKKMVEALANQHKGEVIPTGKKTLGEFLDGWLKDCVKPQLDPYTYSSYETQVRLHIKPALGHVLLRKLTGPQIQRFLDSLTEKKSKNEKDKKLSARTVAYNRTVLRKALEQAVDWREIPHNPAARGIKTPDADARKIDAVTQEEVRAILGALERDRLAALFILYVFTGLRCSEALGLRWSDVDLDGRKIRVNGQLKRFNKQFVIVEPKTSHSKRTLIIPMPAVNALREWRIRQNEERMMLRPDWSDWGLVFTTEMGTPIHRRNVKRTLDRLLTKAKLAHQRIHDLRHAYATLSHGAGEDLKTISENLGHKSIRITADIYTHVSQTVKEMAADRLAAFVASK